MSILYFTIMSNQVTHTIETQSLFPPSDSTFSSLMNKLLISLSPKFFVSGKNSHISTAPIAPMEQNMKYMLLVPMALSNSTWNLVTMKLNNQTAKMAREELMVLDSAGWISALIVHGSEPSPRNIQ